MIFPGKLLAGDFSRIILEVYQYGDDSRLPGSEPGLSLEKENVMKQQNILSDGDYAVGVSLTGGSGKAAVTNPCEFTVLDGQAYATLEWSSSYYDYMIVDGVKYLPVNEEGNSTFEIPIKAFDEEQTVIADTTAMSTAHEVEYTIVYHSDQIMDAKDTPMARARYSVYMAGVIILVCMAVSAGKKYRKKQRMRNS